LQVFFQESRNNQTLSLKIHIKIRRTDLAELLCKVLKSQCIVLTSLIANQERLAKEQAEAITVQERQQKEKLADYLKSDRYQSR